ncbi:PQQ-dependent sugar dehydrogenase [Modicisalibacter luteus]|uniref:PQQ-dependent sugar dehydrogenase n=1 Tax=Modicisalibacter luteus TaxID=453962 RepID=A0ABV7M4Q9_9GAMM|nr:PQQ-dependent sugar dehydrogenase [Halomonas lutea]GHA87656.1 dehydrogenase [Halomonas lutea]
MMRTVKVSTGVATAMLISPLLLAQPDSSIQTEAGAVQVEVLSEGLVHPWGMAFLPDGRALVTEREGRLRILGTDNSLTAPIEGVPDVFSQGQGGLLDVALDPDFQNNRRIYLSFAEPGKGGASTALGRGRLENDRIEGFEVIFRQQPKVSGGYHFGGRIVFTPQGTLFLTLGERFKFDPAQDPSNHLGAIVHLNRDGSVPDNNPFADREDAEDAIWSYGHRNIESAAIHPETGELWIAEMGPLGGDELNLPEAGRNYGWPVVSWGKNYDGSDIPDPPTHPDFADAIKHWTPVISPSGMTFYDGDAFEAWQGSALIGGLSAEAIIRLSNDGRSVTGEEQIPMGARVRDIEQGPEGNVYVLTDQQNGKVIRLSPLE